MSVGDYGKPPHIASQRSIGTFGRKTEEWQARNIPYATRQSKVTAQFPVGKKYVRRAHSINSRCPRQVWGRCPLNNSRQKILSRKVGTAHAEFPHSRTRAISSSAISGSGTAAISMAFLADCRFQHRHTNAQCALSLIITDIFQPDRRRP